MAPTMTTSDSAPATRTTPTCTGSRPRRRTGFAGVVLAALLLTGCAGGTGGTTGSDHSGHDMSGMSPSATASAAPSSTLSTDDGTAAAAAHNEADVMFAQMMIPHHQQAVQLSDIVLAKTGVDPQVTALATKVKAAQAPEIATMQGWLRTWGAPATMDPAHTHAMGGMVADADVQALRDADGSRAGDLFLTQMIGHHEGAVAMAKDEVATGQDRRAVELARQVVTDQSAEIATMKALQH